ncbi:hypothetical protein D3C77_401420 [compost metagenome]
MHRGPVECVQLASGYTVELSLSGDVFDGSAVCEGRLVTAWLRIQSETVPVAVLEAVLLSDGVGTNDCLADACDRISETLQYVIDELSRTCLDDFSTILNIGGAIIVSRLEVRKKFRSSALSQKLVDAVCIRILSQHRLALMALHPFPLQYENTAPEIGSRHYESYWQRFKSDREKLSSYYSYEFGCMSASHDSTLLIKPLDGYACVLGRAGWSITALE